MKLYKDLRYLADYGDGLLVQLNFYWPHNYPALAASPQGKVIHAPINVGDLWTIEITDHGGLPNNYPVGITMRFNPNCAWLESILIVGEDGE